MNTFASSSEAAAAMGYLYIDDGVSNSGVYMRYDMYYSFDKTNPTT